MKFSHNYIKGFILSGLLIAFFSCSLYNRQVNFKLNKRHIYQGDSILLSWNVKRNPKNTKIRLNECLNNLSLKKDTFIKFKNDTMIRFEVFTKNNTRPYTRRKKIYVKKPEITSFSAFRNRFDSSELVLEWEVKEAARVYIEGFKADLPLKGSKKLETYKSGYYTLIAETPFQTLRKTCYFSSARKPRPYVIEEKSIKCIHDNRKITMQIIEADVDDFPKKTKLKVIAYDSLGNFIKDLAPPYGDIKTSNKYFKRIVEKAKDKNREIKFSVREIHEKTGPYDVALSLDYSGSMSNTIKDLEKATEYFISKKFPDDYYSVVKYDHRLLQLTNLLKDKDELIEKASFNGLDTLGGSTAMYAGTDLGIRTLTGNNSNIIILFTDGYENSSLAYFGRFAASIDQLVYQIKSKKAKLIVIGLGNVNKTLLAELVYYTNGYFYHIHKPKDIYEVYKEIQHLFRTYYEITIEPLQEEEEHVVQLTYFNNKDSLPATTERPYFTGENIQLSTYEEDTSAYWYNKKLKSVNYKLAVPPQSLVNFDLDKDKVKKRFYMPLDNIAYYLRKNRNAIVKIYGHTDTRGSNDYNINLSKRRAQAVFKYLYSKGVGSRRMTFEGKGEEFPVWQNDSEEWAAKENRRVEIVIWQRNSLR